MSKRAKFVLEATENSPEIGTVFLDDGVSWREIMPNEVKAFFGFKDQLEMMGDKMSEMCFTDLVYHAKELEEAFKNCRLVLKGKVK